MRASAVGGYYGAALAGRGHAVTFAARSEHLAAMREGGLTVRSDGRATVLHPVHAVADPPEAGGDFDLDRALRGDGRRLHSTSRR
jgi:2-dehydropantoate 2-reductase